MPLKNYGSTSKGPIVISPPHQKVLKTSNGWHHEPQTNKNKNSTWVRTCNPSIMFLFVWIMKTPLMNVLEVNISKFCSWVGITYMTHTTLGSSSDIELLHWSILLWHNPYRKKSWLDILWNYASGTRILYGVGRLSSSMGISTSAWTLITSPYYRIPYYLFYSPSQVPYVTLTFL